MDPSHLPTLHALSDLITSTISTITSYHANAPSTTPPIDPDLPPRPLFDAQRTLLAAAGQLTELLSSPSQRLQEVALQYCESRALHVVVDLRVADILAAESEGEEGMQVGDMAARVGVEVKKLTRLMRSLCSIHVFREVAPERFANNGISAALIGNEHLRAYIEMLGSYPFTMMDWFPRHVTDPELGPSYDIDKAAFQLALQSKQTLWSWAEETTSIKDIKAGKSWANGRYPGLFGAELADTLDGRKDEDVIPRPEHRIMSMGMVGGGRATGKAHVHDFPWASLGAGTVVDVGGGMGGFVMQLHQAHPDLRFVLQDREPVVKKGEAELWATDNPDEYSQGRVQFMAHDFFKENPVKEADVYWLRYVLHDWSDKYCVKILSAIRKSMGPKSRILICDQVMNTTYGNVNIPSAPKPLPANYGYHKRYCHQRDILLLGTYNAIERTPEEFESIISEAGLKLRKLWDCRSAIGLVEAVLPDSPLLEEQT